MSAPWESVREVLEEALAREETERDAWLEQRCADDPELHAEVLSLLREDGESDSFLDRPPGAELLCDALAEEPLELFAGDEIGPYRVRELLASGGMGSVYLAERHGDDFVVPVAIKVIKLGMDSREIVRRFREERRVLARLEHPGIARLLDGGTTADGRPFLAMEYVRGVPIDRFCAERDLPVEQRLSLFTKVCAAVHAAHGSLVVHRDLKPANILVTPEGEPKLLDFGISKILDPGYEDSETVATLGVSQILTPEYASPEQLRGEPVTTQADIYSLGIVLYELLTGRRPYRVNGRSRSEVQRLICEEDPTRPSLVVSADSRAVSPRHLRGDVDNIVLKTLQKDPDQRYSSADQLADDVRRHMVGLPVRARPDTWSYRTTRFAKRHRVGVGAAIAVVVALGIGLLSAMRFAWRAREAEARAERQLEEVMRFSDAMLVRELQERAAELWPAWPSRADAMQVWLRRAEDVLDRRARHEAARLEVHRDTLALQRSAGILDPQDAEPLWDAADATQRWRFLTSEAVLQGMDTLEATHEEVAERMADARSLRERSVDGFAGDWEEATRSIFVSDLYSSLRLTPQMGLVPLGTDPDSGLWEFWHVDSGERPERDPVTRRLRFAEDSGIVFVLLPGGSFWFGAQKQDPGGIHYDEFLDPDPHARGPQRVALGPFLLAKCELTQGQWLRLHGHNPSYFPVGTEQLGVGAVDLRHPVEQVSWHDSREALRRWGLRLPSDAEWEYASRAGTDTVWPSGSDPSSLIGYGNLAGRESVEHRSSGATHEATHRDGFLIHAPVGSFLPNGFGLHDLCGNLWEWCEDEVVQQAGAAGAGARVARGGSYDSNAMDARSAHFSRLDPAVRHRALGLRAARSLDD